MDNGFIILLIILFIVSILSVCYWEYRVKSKSFSLKNSVLAFFKGLLLYFTFLLVIGVAYRVFIPLNKNHGMTFNDERERLGIPILTPDW